MGNRVEKNSFRFAMVRRNDAIKRVEFDDLKAGDLFVLCEPTNGKLVYSMPTECIDDPQSVEYSLHWMRALSDPLDGSIKTEPLRISEVTGSMIGIV